MMNSCCFLGRLVAAPEPRGNGDNLAAAFTLAVPRDRKEKDGSRLADFVDCVAFGKVGEIALGYLKKGRRVAVSGRLTVRTYTNQNGENRRSWSIIVTGFDFCDSCATAAPAEEAPPRVDDDYPF